MNNPSMSLSRMLHINQNENDPIKHTGKVKVFYNFKGSDTHCLCTFGTTLDSKPEKDWVGIPLKKCLVNVCSSCPDQLMDDDSAVYSANFEESMTVENWSPLHDSRSKIIWEGHGLLSNIIKDQENTTQITGKITKSTVPSYFCFIEVLIQLHPIRHSSPAQHQVEKAPSLPSVRSIWTDMGSYPEHGEGQSTHPFPQLLQHPIQTNDSPQRNYHLISRSRTIKDERHYHHGMVDPSWSGSRYNVDSFNKDETKKRRASDFSERKLSHSPVTDTYYHQSRRKKRDTKPPNANDVRPFIEIEKDNDGNPIFPAEVDSWTVLSLGSVVWDRAAFHNQRYIYPVGYRVKKWYRSMVDPHSDTQYTCEILDGGDEPIFQLNADDNPSECWRGPTPTTVWTIAVRRAFAIRNMDYGHNPVGPDFFGLRKNTIAKMIQDLPNADKCKNYIWQNFEAMTSNKGKSSRRSKLSPPSDTKDEEEETGSLEDKKV